MAPRDCVRGNQIIAMKSYLVLFPIFFLALFQGAFLSLNLVLLSVLLWATFKPVKEVLWVAFWAGLMLDLAKGTAIGLSSCLLLIVCLCLLLYRRRFDVFHPVFLPFFVFLADWFYNRFFDRPFSWFQSLALVVLAVLVRFLFVRVFNMGEKNRLKLL